MGAVGSQHPMGPHSFLTDMVTGDDFSCGGEEEEEEEDISEVLAPASHMGVPRSTLGGPLPHIWGSHTS